MPSDPLAVAKSLSRVLPLHYTYDLRQDTGAMGDPASLLDPSKPEDDPEPVQGSNGHAALGDTQKDANGTLSIDVRVFDVPSQAESWRQWWTTPPVARAYGTDYVVCGRAVIFGKWLDADPAHTAQLQAALGSLFTDCSGDPPSPAATDSPVASDPSFSTAPSDATSPSPNDPYSSTAVATDSPVASDPSFSTAPSDTTPPSPNDPYSSTAVANWYNQGSVDNPQITATGSQIISALMGAASNLARALALAKANAGSTVDCDSLQAQIDTAKQGDGIPDTPIGNTYDDALLTLIQAVNACTSTDYSYAASQVADGQAKLKATRAALMTKMSDG